MSFQKCSLRTERSAPPATQITDQNHDQFNFVMYVLKERISKGRYLLLLELVCAESYLRKQRFRSIRMKGVRCNTVIRGKGARLSHNFCNGAESGVQSIHQTPRKALSTDKETRFPLPWYLHN